MRANRQQLAALLANVNCTGNAAAAKAITKAAKRPPAWIAGHNAVTAYVPVQTPSILNERMDPMKLHELKKRQREAVYLKLRGVPLPELSVRVRLSRIIPRRGKPLDGHDNLHASLKAVADEIADLYGVPDNDPRIKWLPPEQVKVPEMLSPGVRVQIAPVTVECPDCGGTGVEQIPCGPDDTTCEFCNGSGRRALTAADAAGGDR